MQSFLVTAAGPAIQILLGLVALGAYIYFIEHFTEAFAGFVRDLWLVSLFWAILNLIPVHPLDGGQMLAAMMGPKRRRLFLQLSIAFAVLCAVGLFVAKIGILMPIFLLYFAYQNFQELRNFR
jgi:Zn-dependent protease